MLSWLYINATLLRTITIDSVHARTAKGLQRKLARLVIRMASTEHGKGYKGYKFLQYMFGVLNVFNITVRHQVARKLISKYYLDQRSRNRLGYCSFIYFIAHFSHSFVDMVFRALYFYTKSMISTLAKWPL